MFAFLVSFHVVPSCRNDQIRSWIGFDKNEAEATSVRGNLPRPLLETAYAEEREQSQGSGRAPSLMLSKQDCDGCELQVPRIKCGQRYL